MLVLLVKSTYEHAHKRTDVRCHNFRFLPSTNKGPLTSVMGEEGATRQPKQRLNNDDDKNPMETITNQNCGEPPTVPHTGHHNQRQRAMPPNLGCGSPEKCPKNLVAILHEGRAPTGVGAQVPPQAAGEQHRVGVDLQGEVRLPPEPRVVDGVPEVQEELRVPRRAVLRDPHGRRGEDLKKGIRVWGAWARRGGCSGHMGEVDRGESPAQRRDVRSQGRWEYRVPTWAPRGRMYTDLAHCTSLVVSTGTVPVLSWSCAGTTLLDFHHSQARRRG